MKVGILCSSSLNEFNFRVLDNIITYRKGDEIMGFIDISLTKSLISKFIHNLRKGRGGYIFIMLLSKILKKKTVYYESSELFASQSFPHFKTLYPYRQDFLELLRKTNLEVLVYLNGFGVILKEPLIHITPKGILSYHHGNMRKYRGQPAGFWELYNGDSSMGITVQRLSAGIDTGEPIAERNVEILRTDSLKKLKKRFYENSVDLMLLALNNVESNFFTPPIINEYGKLYTLPNMSEWLILQIRITRRKFVEWVHHIWVTK